MPAALIGSLVNRRVALGTVTVTAVVEDLIRGS
jgi:hypothetical protein